jgi:hypothetical protein
MRYRTWNLAGAPAPPGSPAYVTSAPDLGSELLDARRAGGTVSHPLQKAGPWPRVVGCQRASRRRRVLAHYSRRPNGMALGHPVVWRRPAERRRPTGKRRQSGDSCAAPGLRRRLSPRGDAFNRGGHPREDGRFRRTHDALPLFFPIAAEDGARAAHGDWGALRLRPQAAALAALIQLDTKPAGVTPVRTAITRWRPLRARLGRRPSGPAGRRPGRRLPVRPRR